MTSKTANEIRMMERAGRLAAQTLTHVGQYIKPGITTNELNQIAHDFILRNEAIPAPLNYHGFPKSVCTSPNQVICHGVPDNTLLKEGDIVNVDVTCIKDGYHGDTSRTFFVGEVSERAKKLTNIAKKSMHKGIEAARANAFTGDIGFAIEKFVTRQGYFVVRELGGHGIGEKFHEDPFIPSFGKKGKGQALIKWGTITVEPMVNETDAEIQEMDIQGSTIKYYVTGDGSLSAQFEHTILITDREPQILTQD